MIEKFINHLHQRLPLNSEEEELLRQTLTVKRFDKGDFILQEGSISNAFYFNLSGFVRLFYVKNAAEKTAYFYSEGTFISAYESFVKRRPTAFNLQATEATALVEITLEASGKLLHFSPKFDALARMIMEEELITNQKIIAQLLTLSPEERYLQLLHEQPEIFQKVPQHNIASYIGVQPESLSRIKKRALERES